MPQKATQAWDGAPIAVPFYLTSVNLAEKIRKFLFMTQRRRSRSSLASKGVVQMLMGVSCICVHACTWARYLFRSVFWRYFLHANCAVAEWCWIALRRNRKSGYWVDAIDKVLLEKLSHFRSWRGLMLSDMSEFAHDKAMPVASVLAIRPPKQNESCKRNSVSGQQMCPKTRVSRLLRKGRNEMIVASRKLIPQYFDRSTILTCTKGFKRKIALKSRKQPD